MKPFSGYLGGLGLALTAGGLVFATAAWLITSYMPLVALGVCSIILGVVSISLGWSVPRLSAEAGERFMEASLDNIASLIEELGGKTKAIYLPSSVAGVPGKALIPLSKDENAIPLSGQIERRFIVTFGSGAEHVGLLVTPPGAASVRGQTVPRATTESDFESLLTTVLSGELDLVQGVRVLSQEGGQSQDGHLRVVLERPSISFGSHQADVILGSPLASVVATMVAEATQTPVRIVSEDRAGRRHFVELILLSSEAKPSLEAV